ncbi:hypothetical protein C7974DRAFT_417883 [Boeremia exigua]|uniref:uncharacterized protein n=1 Tax=Boeremia exigua TaxID=749465 RepID=UPI001E8CABF0|nr:uncharacterized protein C7974DRAFT_417883 [Boeremia exigua]KAH6614150.1 hypothetical protein C7974DRAFT_417883 [Boeremia exigua]
MAVTPPAPQRIVQPQRNPEVAERDTDTRPPRSRYRQVNGQRSSSGGIVDHWVTKDTRPQSMDYIQDPGRLSYIQGLQCVNSAKPQPVSAEAAAKEARKSMPNLMAIRNPSHAMRASPKAGPEYSQTYSGGAHAAHASSTFGYGGAFQPAYMRTKEEPRSHDRGFKLDDRSTTDSVHTTQTNSTGAAVSGLQSQQGSLHAVTPDEQTARQQYFEDTSAPRLQVVGSEGVYGAPERARDAMQAHQRNHSAPAPRVQPSSIVELDSTVSSNTIFVAKPPARPMMAEQHAARDGEASNQHEYDVRSALHTSPALPERGSLPASLVAGRPGMHAHRSSPNHTGHSDGPTPTFSTRHTNAYRYSSYAPSSTEVFEAFQNQGVAPIYKPYRPFVATDKLNRTDSLSSVYSPVHKRNASDIPNAKHDSITLTLAKEYQDLIGVQRGYMSD